MTPFRLIQEDHMEDPWRVLLACVLLNQTRVNQVRPVLEELLDEWPDAYSMSNAPIEDVCDIIQRLGLKKRGGYIIEMSAEYMTSRPKVWTDVLELTGCGRYAAECWRMLIQGERNFIPKDLKLRQRMIWWRLDECTVRKTNQGDIALFLPSSEGNWPIIAIPRDQNTGGYCRDLLLANGKEEKHWIPIYGLEPSTVAEQWLSDASLIKLTDRAKEAAMLVVISSKGKFAGKFADDQAEVAKAAAPVGSVVVVDQADLLVKVPNIIGLLALYNSILAKDDRVKKFADDVDAAGASELVWKAAEGKTQKVKAAVAEKTPGAKEKLRAALIEAGATGLTYDEMAAAVGCDKKRVSDYMCYLKNAKFAGTKGPIAIFKMGDHYTVDSAAHDAYAAAEAEKAAEAKAASDKAAADKKAANAEKATADQGTANQAPAEP